MVLLQEPYVNKFGKITCVPSDYAVFSRFDFEKRFFSAAVLVKKEFKCDIHYDESTNECVTVSIYLKSRIIRVSSVYCSPSLQSLDYQLSILDRMCNSFYVIGGDFNAKSPMWLNGVSTDHKGKELEDFVTCKQLVVINDPDSPTYYHHYSSPDVTIASIQLLTYIENWRVLQDPPSLSDHLYISFDLSFNDEIREKNVNQRYNFKKTNWDVFSAVLLNRIDEVFACNLASEEAIDSAVDHLTKLLQNAIKESTPMRHNNF